MLLAWSRRNLPAWEPRRRRRRRNPRLEECQVMGTAAGLNEKQRSEHAHGQEHDMLTVNMTQCMRQRVVNRCGRPSRSGCMKV